jgi:peptidoglycan-associated lipoprotein
MLNKITAVMFALLFAVGCSGMKGAGAGGMGVAAPGTQMDLEVNVGDRVFYALDSSSLNEDAQATLTRQAAWLKANPGIRATVEGHCDERGTREYNLGLGERRATAAKNFLVSAGIEAERLSTISYGKERPAVEGHSEDTYRQNRRAVTIVN